VPFTLDTVAPTLSLTSPLADAVLDGGQSVSGVSDATAVTYRFDANAPASVLFDGGTGQFSQTLDIAGLANGSHDLTVRAIDAAGNATSQTLSVSVNLAQTFCSARCFR